MQDIGSIALTDDEGRVRPIGELFRDKRHTVLIFYLGRW
jgi:hypothetical protein